MADPQLRNTLTDQLKPSQLHQQQALLGLTQHVHWGQLHAKQDHGRCFLDQQTAAVDKLLDTLSGHLDPPKHINALTVEDGY